MAQNENLTLGDKLQALPKSALFAILLVMTSVPLFFGDKLSVPNKPDQSAIDFYTAVMAVPEGSTILISSDWTNSTRGESGGHFEALMRILMRKNIKFAVYTTADPQAPQVAQDAIARINLEREKAGQPRHERWRFRGHGIGRLSSGQLVGMAAGLKGVYDVETMMENGVNNPESKVKVASTKSQEPVPGFPGMQNAGKGSTYYPTLHFALTLMILAVVIGNVGMMLSKRGAR